MKTLENLKWRYATKSFDTTKKISNIDINKLQESIQLAPAAYGLQLFKVLIIENQELKEKLRPFSYDQAQITEASHLIVFCNQINYDASEVDAYIKNKAETQNIDIENLTDFSNFIKGAISSYDAVNYVNWTAKQTYLALGGLLVACADLKIDACPMEGFDAQKYNEILGLESQGLTASVIAPIGYRSKEDQTQYLPKVRKSKEVLFELI